VQQRLVVWVEGDFDRLFVDAVIRPRLEWKYAAVVVRGYRQRETRVVNGLLQSMAHQGFSRMFLADMDLAPCITSRKEKVKQRYPSLEYPEIIVVSREIESWYLAGLTNQGATALKLNPPPSTDHLTKGDLDRLRPARFDSDLDFLLETLKYFDAEIACTRNRSFAYFHSMLGWS
jgi:hypothetical protein